MSSRPNRLKIYSILALAVFSVSTAAILIRLAVTVSPVRGIGFSLFLAASRLILASIVLLPNWFNLFKYPVPLPAYYYAIFAGVCLSLHFAFWIASLSYTSIVASTTLVTTSPLWIALINRLFFQEKLSVFTYLGLVISLLGGICIALGDGNVNPDYPNPLLGNSLALGGSFTVSLYMLAGKAAQKRGLNTGNYITIAYTIAGLVLLPFPLLFGTDYTSFPLPVYIYVLLMALIPQLIGHTGLNWSLRWLSPTIVSLVVLLEPIFSTLLGILLFNEIPGKIVLIGSAILLLGVGIAVVGNGYD